MANKKNPNQRMSKKVMRQAERARATRMKQIRYGGIAVIVIATIAALVVWRNAGKVPLEDILASTAPNLAGSADAPIQIMEFGDFGCPACRAWHNAGIQEQLKAEYGDQISFEFRHFPVITANSPKGAEAAQCAAEQGAFWEFHDFVYEQTGEPSLTNRSLKGYATQLNLDQSSFDSCLDSGKYESYIFNDAQAARAAGARGTPTFLVNGQLAPSPSYDNLSSLIQAALDNS